VAETIQPEWWAGFRDPELTSIEKRVAAANLDVRAATIRLAESRAERRITAAAEFPQINGSAFYMRQLPSEKGVLSLFGSSGSSTETAGANGIPSTVTGTQIPAFNLWQYGFDASWELDLWGRVRRSIEAADATIEASAEARRDILLSVLAEVARDYIQLRGIQTQLQISRANLRIARESLALTKMRAANGLATELDVADASARVSTTEATIARLEEQQAQAINRLSFLLGEPPRTLAAELATPHAIPPVPPKVPVGLPSELAHRRPDIRQAEAQLHAQTAEIGVAVANFYPAITLNGSFALQAVDFKNLGSWAARTYTIGPGISLPIFEGGRLVGNLRLTEAQQQEAAILYQRTVLAAWQEVDDALTAYAAEQRRRERLAQAVEQNRRALDLSLVQYKQGIIAFLQVLTAEQQLLAAEQQTADSTTTVSTNLVSLYKALGGGWEGAFPRREKDKTLSDTAAGGGR
jgi:NodT family efflux transporter outer membrane factor (OMF) lipoprotein